MIKSVHGIVHGKTIELDEESGFPDGQSVAVDIRPAVGPGQILARASMPWIERLAVDANVQPGKFVIRGTRVLLDLLVERIAAGQTENDILKDHPDLTHDDLAAAREYSKVPAGMRRSFGALADEAGDLDEYLEATRRGRHARQRSDD